MVGVSIEGILRQVAQLPLSEQQLLKQLLNDCDSAAAVSSEPELSLTRAAEMLNVSAGFIERLLARGELKNAASASSSPVI